MPARVRDSLRGLREAWRRERSVRTHTMLSGIAIVGLIAVQPAPIWVVAVSTLLVAGLAAELFNGAIEAALDTLHPGRDPSIGAAKDMASASAFVINVAAGVAFAAALLSRL